MKIKILNGFNTYNIYTTNMIKKIFRISIGHLIRNKKYKSGIIHDKVYIHNKIENIDHLKCPINNISNGLKDLYQRLKQKLIANNNYKDDTSYLCDKFIEEYEVFKNDVVARSLLPIIIDIDILEIKLKDKN